MLYELRNYAIPLGRMPDIQARLLREVPPLFRVHDMLAVGHWTVLAGPRMPAFIYLMQWRDAAHRETAWGQFAVDDRWLRIRRETNGESELVESYAMSLLKPNRRWPAPFPETLSRTPGEVHDFVVQGTANGQNDAVAGFLAAEVLPIFIEAGARTLAVLDAMTGPVVPSIAYFLAWPGYEARAAGWAAYHRRVKLRDLTRDQIEKFHRPLLGAADVYLLEPEASIA